MRMRTTRERVVRRCLLPALFARFLIPLGFMPGDLLAGEYLKPCPAAIPALQLFSPIHGHQGHDQHQGHGHQQGHEQYQRHDQHQGHDQHHEAGSHTDLVSAERQCPVGLLVGALFVATTVPAADGLPRPGASYARPATARQTLKPLRRYRSRAPPSYS